MIVECCICKKIFEETGGYVLWRFGERHILLCHSCENENLTYDNLKAIADEIHKIDKLQNENRPFTKD